MAITRRKFVNGTNLIFRIVSNGGYLFKRWDDSSTDNPRTFAVNKNYTQQVLYVETFQLTLASDTTGSVQTFKIDGETISTKEVEKNSTHTVSVIPGAGWAFVKWLDDPTAPQTREVTITEDTTLRVEMVKLHYVDTVVTHTGSGTIAVNGADNVTRFEIRHGDTITVTARPNTTAQWRFEKWEPPYETQPQTFQITVLEDLTISVTYIKQYKVTITDTPTGFGTSTINGLPSPQLIDELDETTLLATPTSSQFAFVNWLKEDGTIASTDNPYVFDIDEDKVLTAHYTYQHLVSLTSSDVTLGTVHVDTETAGATCQKYILDGATATITATEVGGKFLRWSDLSEAPVRTLPIYQALTLTATFVQPTLTVTANTVSIEPENVGHVNIDDVEATSKSVAFSTETKLEGISDDVAQSAFQEWHCDKPTYNVLTPLQYLAGIHPLPGPYAADYSSQSPVLAVNTAGILLGSEGSYSVIATVNGVTKTFSQEDSSLIVSGDLAGLVFTTPQTFTSLVIADRSYTITAASPTPTPPSPTEVRVYLHDDTALPLEVYIDKATWTSAIRANGNIMIEANGTAQEVTPSEQGDTYKFTLARTSYPLNYFRVIGNDVTEQNPFTRPIKEDVTYTAYFSDPVSITAYTSRAAVGTVPANLNSVTFNGSAPAETVTKLVGVNSTTTLTFIGETIVDAGEVIELYEFNNWKVGTTVKSTDNPYVFKTQATSGGTYSANATRRQVDVIVSDDTHPIEHGSVLINSVTTPISRAVKINVDTELQGVADTGYIFAGWYTEDGTLITKDNPYTTKFVRETKIFPQFHEKVSLTLTTNLERQYTSLYIDDELLAVGADTKDIDKTIEHKIEAIFEESVTYQFIEWRDAEGHRLTTQNPAYLTFDEDTTLTAYFDQFRYITIKNNVPNPSQLIINGAIRTFGKSYLYPLNEDVNISINVDESYKFLQWADLTPETIVEWSVASSYAANTHVKVTDTYGNVTTYASRILVPAPTVFTVGTTYLVGARVKVPVPETTPTEYLYYESLVEQPEVEEFIPANWRLDTAPSPTYWDYYTDPAVDTSRTVTMDRAYEFTANFEPQYKLTVDFDPQRCTALIDGTQLTEAHKYKYVMPNTSHTFEVVALEGFAFVKWDDNVVDNPRTVTVTSSVTYTPVMTPPKLYVRMNKEVASGCSVYIDVPGQTSIILTDPTHETHEIYATVPDPTFAFVEWDDHNTSNPRIVGPFTQDAYYKAIFHKSCTITLNNPDPTKGTIAFVGEEPTVVTKIIEEGGTYDVFATSVAPNQFTHWNVPEDHPYYNVNPGHFTAEDDFTVEATFQEQVKIELDFKDTRGSVKSELLTNEGVKYRTKASGEEWSEWRTATTSNIYVTPLNDVEVTVDSSVITSYDAWIRLFDGTTYAIDIIQSRTKSYTAINLDTTLEVEVRPVWNVTWKDDPTGSCKWYTDVTHTTEKIMPPRVFDEVEELFFTAPVNPDSYELVEYYQMTDDVTPDVRGAELYNFNEVTGLVDTSDQSRCHYVYHRSGDGDLTISLKENYEMQIYTSTDGSLIASKTLRSTMSAADYSISAGHAQDDYIIFRIKKTSGEDITSGDLASMLTFTENACITIPKSTSSTVFSKDSTFVAYFDQFVTCKLFSTYNSVGSNTFVKDPAFTLPHTVVANESITAGYVITNAQAGLVITAECPGHVVTNSFTANAQQILVDGTLVASFPYTYTDTPSQVLCNGAAIIPSGFVIKSITTTGGTTSLQYPDGFTPDFSSTVITIDSVPYYPGASEATATEVKLTVGRTVPISITSPTADSKFTNYLFTPSVPFTPDATTPSTGTFVVPSNDFTLDVRIDYLVGVSLRAYEDESTTPPTVYAVLSTIDYEGTVYTTTSGDISLKQRINSYLPISATNVLTGYSFERFYDTNDNTNTFSTDNPWYNLPILDEYDVSVAVAIQGQIKIIIPCGIQVDYTLAT